MRTAYLVYKYVLVTGLAAMTINGIFVAWQGAYFAYVLSVFFVVVGFLIFKDLYLGFQILTAALAFATILVLFGLFPIFADDGLKLAHPMLMFLGIAALFVVHFVLMMRMQPFMKGAQGT